MKMCVIDGCGRPLLARGWCNKHYHRWNRWGDPLTVDRRRRVEAVCSVDDCKRMAKVKGWCTMHYSRWKRRGDPLTVDRPHSLNGAICSVDDCTSAAKSATGFCRKHHMHRGSGIPCCVEGCEQFAQPGNSPACSMHTNRMRKNGAYGPPGRLKAKRGESQWRIMPNGYVYAKDPAKNGSTAQHRSVMEEALGRPLKSHENVHHRNGIRHDNRLENLELWSTSQPCGQRVEDKVAWAREILALYAPALAL